VNELQTQVAQEIRRVVKGMDPTQPLTPTTRLLDEGLLSSLELLELVLGLETALSTSIPLEELTSENFETIHDIAAMVKRAADAK